VRLLLSTTFAVAGIGCQAIAPEADPEAVLAPGDTLTLRNGSGEIRVRATSALGREFTWEGATRSLTLWRREAPWHGAKSLYFPGPGDHWRLHNGISRAVVEEGRIDFETSDAMNQWIADRLLDFRSGGDGLIAGWGINPSRRQLNVEIWQVTVNGQAPAKLSGVESGGLAVLR
jgi:hypothetical protein